MPCRLTYEVKWPMASDGLVLPRLAMQQTKGIGELVGRNQA